MSSNLRNLEDKHILAFGHDPEHKIDFPSDVAEHSHGEYAPCHSCYAHFPPEEMGIMDSPPESYIVYRQRLQLCNKCRDKEIYRLVDILGISPDIKFNFNEIEKTVYLNTIKYNRLEDISNVEKLMFLLKSKKQ